MSRNVRQRNTATPARKVSKARRQSFEDSSDDDYGGVDQISDSEEDEPDVEVAEEQAIIESEDDQGTPRPYTEDEEPWEGFTLDDNEILHQNVASFDDHLAALALATDGELFLADGDETTSTRRVHFNISDSDSNDDEEDSFFPDIFLPKDELDSRFRREIDRDDGDGLMSDGSWDYNGHELPEEEIARAIEENEDDQDDDDASDADSDSSGYDSDESGYTTDEDITASARFAAPEVLTREPSHASQTSTEEEVRRSPIGRVPKLGVWTVSNNRPFMVAKNDLKLILFNRNAGQRRFSADAITPTPMQTPVRMNRLIDSSPMISNSGNIMMSAMADFNDPFNLNNQFLDGQALGPPEAFYAFKSIDADGNVAQDSSSAYEDDLSDDDPWNLEDFLEFGDEDTDNDNGLEAEPSSDSAGGDVPSSTPARPTTARSEDQVHPLLDHFDKGVVGSFRRNQNRHQLLTRNIASRDSLAFGGTHLDGTIRGVKSGRLHHANTPITPARKARNLKPVIPSSPASPLAQLNRKRRYDGEEFNGHKRNKSLI